MWSGRCQQFRKIIWGPSTLSLCSAQPAASQLESRSILCLIIHWIAAGEPQAVSRRSNSTAARAPAQLSHLSVPTSYATQQHEQLSVNAYTCSSPLGASDHPQPPPAAATRTVPWPAQVYCSHQLQHQALMHCSSWTSLQWRLQDSYFERKMLSWVCGQAWRGLQHSRPPAPGKRPSGPPKPKPDVKKPQLRRNNNIKAAMLMVVLPDGTKQEMDFASALEAAASEGLDLVEVNSKVNPPVARIMDWRKFEYEQRQKEEAAEKARRQQQKLATPKEMQFSARIADHDLEVKLRKVAVWLEQGYRVQFVVKHGREEESAANEALDYLVARVEADYTIEAGVKQAQRRAVSLLVKPVGATGAAAKRKGSSGQT